MFKLKADFDGTGGVKPVKITENITQNTWA